MQRLISMMPYAEQSVKPMIASFVLALSPLRIAESSHSMRASNFLLYRRTQQQVGLSI